MESGNRINNAEFNQPELIRNQYSDIDFSSALEQMEDIKNLQPNNYDIFRVYKIDLPSAIDSVSISYRRSYELDSNEPDTEPVHGVQGSILSRPEVVNKHANWSSVYLANLRARLLDDYGEGFDAKTIRHDIDAIYLPVNDVYYARVAAVADYDTCDINVNMIDVDSDDYTLSRNSKVSQEDALRKYLMVYGKALDCFIECFGDKQDIENRLLVSGAQWEVGTYKSKYSLGANAVKNEVKLGSIDDRPNPEKSPERLIRLDDIGGVYDVKRRLRQIADDLTDPEMAAMYGLSSSHFMLHGGPGTGKTSLVQAFVNEAGAEVKNVSTTDISDKYIGESAKNIDEIFDDAIAQSDGKPMVIFMDEIDSIIGGQANGSNAIEAKRQLLQRMNDLSNNHPNIIVAAATNSDLDRIDQAFLRSGRFEGIGIPTPTEAERKDIWSVLISRSEDKLKPFWQDKGVDLYQSYQLDQDNQLTGGYDLDQLAGLTADWTGADIHKALENARRICRDIHRQTGQPTQLTNEILLQAVRNFGR